MADVNAVDERDEELEATAAIYPELQISENDKHCASITIEVMPQVALGVHFTDTTRVSARSEVTYLTYLPSIQLRILLPEGYPQDAPPAFTFSTHPNWLPDTVLKTLQNRSNALWEEYGRSQVVFAAIDLAQQEAESAFGLGSPDASPLVLRGHLESPLVKFDRQMKRDKFGRATFDCGVCLEPKRGTVCYRLRHCGHVFCVSCLQDYYRSAITEGEVSRVTCLDPDCGKIVSTAGSNTGATAHTAKLHTLHPTELLDIPLETSTVQRYIDMKLKKMLESDRTTIYCPRVWCQAPARSAKYAKYLENKSNFAAFPDSESEDEIDDDAPVGDENGTEDDGAASIKDEDRLAICSACSYAFCRTCRRVWHGDAVRCRRTAATMTEFSEEDKASLNFIRANTSPCPYCDAPTTKTGGCNHMRCPTCKTHFCYLCSSWLSPTNPFSHFNTVGGSCYQKLWELNNGDEGGQAAGGTFAETGLRGIELMALAAEERERAAVADASAATNPS